MRWIDRREAGNQLAEKLKPYDGTGVVCALPRGGVETGAAVAEVLRVPLSTISVRKIGHPLDPEYAVGAVTAAGSAVWNEHEVATLDTAWREHALSKARSEAKRLQKLYHDGRPPVRTRNQVVIVVDDGMATGLTMQAAVISLRRSHPKMILAAAPVASREAVDKLKEIADEIITVENPDKFAGNVGVYYDIFPQLTDDDVMTVLDEAAEFS